MLKRLFDVLVAFFGLLCLSPLLLLVAILIKVDSAGPVFFRQSRVGRDGRLFRIIKFRTMVSDASTLGPALTEPKDPRITQLGSILRWTKIDELPQLINVLAGTMSLVGPRPEIPSFVEHYTQEQRKVLGVRPGIVGPSQLLGRHELDQYPERVNVEEYYRQHILPDKLRLDLQYVQGVRFINDLGWFLRGIQVTILGSFKVRYLFQGKRRLLFLTLDIVLTALSCYLAFYFRYDGIIPPENAATMAWMIPALILLRVPFYVYFGLYQTLWQYLGLEDVKSVLKAVLASTVVGILCMTLFGFRTYSRSLLLLDAVLLTALLVGCRVLFKLVLERFRRSLVKHPHWNTLILGAGTTGEMLVYQLIAHPEMGRRPVGFVDDDDAKQGMKIHGIRVLGRSGDIQRIVRVKKVREVIVAVSNVTGERIQAVFAYCKNAGIGCRIAPQIRHLATDRAIPFRIHDLNVEDLLGRTEIKLDYEGINSLLYQKIILVTGGAGSIGSELCRQIMEHAPKKLLIVDRSENDLFELDHELRGFPWDGGWECRLGDILNQGDMEKLFKEYRPDVVFHAAAYKHVPMMEANIPYALKGNVLGTKLLVDLAGKYRVSRFVLISTDKVVNPTSVMGATKKIAELYLKCMANEGITQLITVRFGNVFASRGSVVPLFQKQIGRGGPVTITHPDIQRYFMGISEAVLLVLEAARIGSSGQVYRLDMGEPIKIVDLARKLIKFSGLRDGEIKITYIGLRPGEKLSEELVASNETETETQHAKIRLIEGPRTDRASLLKSIADLEELVLNGHPAACLKALKKLIPEYGPKKQSDKSNTDEG